MTERAGTDVSDFARIQAVPLPDECKNHHTEMFEVGGVMYPPNTCARCGKWYPPYMAGVPTDVADQYCWGHQIEDATAPWKEALGDLVDALHDELRAEVGRNEHVINRVEFACRLLDGPYMPYVGSWF